MFSKMHIYFNKVVYNWFVIIKLIHFGILSATLL